MHVKGLLVGVRRYSFADRETGENVRGAKVSVGVPSDDDRSAGYVVQEIPALYDDYDALAAASKELAGKQVAVVCEVQLKGRYTRLRAGKIVAQ